MSSEDPSLFSDFDESIIVSAARELFGLYSMKDSLIFINRPDVITHTGMKLEDYRFRLMRRTQTLAETCYWLGQKPFGTVK
ncbi:12588_t:CDS:2, partial [Dentiscutata heterogama]